MYRNRSWINEKLPLEGIENTICPENFVRLLEILGETHLNGGKLLFFERDFWRLMLRFT